jgi:hypothetical protein
MSDVMLLGVLRMPHELLTDELSLLQFIDRARQAADRIEADALRIESLERSNTEMLRALRAVADSDALKVSPDLRYLARAVVGNAKVGAV